MHCGIASKLQDVVLPSDRPCLLIDTGTGSDLAIQSCDLEGAPDKSIVNNTAPNSSIGVNGFPLILPHMFPRISRLWGILFCVTDKTKASFIPPMLLVRTERLPEGNDWLYELKFDGYRSIAFKTGGKIYLRSRNN